MHPYGVVKGDYPSPSTLPQANVPWDRQRTTTKKTVRHDRHRRGGSRRWCGAAAASRVRFARARHPRHAHAIERDGQERPPRVCISGAARGSGWLRAAPDSDVYVRIRLDPWKPHRPHSCRSDNSARSISDARNATQNATQKEKELSRFRLSS